MYVEMASTSPPPYHTGWGTIGWSIHSPCDPDQWKEKRGADKTGGLPDIPMAQRRRPWLCPILVVDVDDEVSVNGKDVDKDANYTLAIAVIANDKGFGYRYGSLGGETGRGGSASSSLLLSGLSIQAEIWHIFIQFESCQMFPGSVGDSPYRGDTRFTSISEGEWSQYGHSKAPYVRRCCCFSSGEG